MCWVQIKLRSGKAKCLEGCEETRELGSHAWKTPLGAATLYSLNFPHEMQEQHPPLSSLQVLKRS